MPASHCCLRGCFKVGGHAGRTGRKSALAVTHSGPSLKIHVGAPPISHTVPMTVQIALLRMSRPANEPKEKPEIFLCSQLKKQKKQSQLSPQGGISS